MYTWFCLLSVCSWGYPNDLLCGALSCNWGSRDTLLCHKYLDYSKQKHRSEQLEKVRRCSTGVFIYIFKRSTLMKCPVGPVKMQVFLAPSIDVISCIFLPTYTICEFYGAILFWSIHYNCICNNLSLFSIEIKYSTFLV